MPELTVSIFSHYFLITHITPRGRTAVNSFARKMVQMGFVRNSHKYIYTSIKTFAASVEDRSEFRFHINQLNEFKIHLVANYIVDDMVVFKEMPTHEPVKVKLEIQKHWSDREDQIPVIGYLISNAAPRAKFVNLQTGKGKSYCAMRAMEEIGYRTIVIVRPMYIEKWVEDIRRTYVLETEDLMVIRGSDQLMALLHMAQQGELNSKIILLSNKTYQNWIKLYEKFKFETLHMGYPCTPDRLCEALGVGIRLVDEVHQDFHLQFKIDCYTNVERSISLSATLLSDDDFINNMYEIAYPAALRYKGPAYDKYVAATAVIYKLKFPNKIRCKDYVSKNYSHHLFEQSVLRSDSLTNNYLKLIEQVFRGSYLKDYKKGQRCLIFCISIDMCTVVTAYMKKAFPNLDIRRYVEDDEFSDLMEADVSVSTMQSSGTAVDIPNLTTVIMTTAMASSQGNIQGLGRLRALKDGTTPQFLYFVCEDIPKHIDYHERKRVILEARAKTYRSIFIGGPL